MGKIRVKTLGSEDKEKQEKKKAEARAQSKKLKEQEVAKSQSEAQAATSTTAAPVEEIAKETTGKKEEKKDKFKTKAKKQTHGSAYLSVAKFIERNKSYPLAEALTILSKLQRAKFDETVELHINMIEKGISGNVVLPHGTGKQVRVAIADSGNDQKTVEELIKKIEKGTIDFDVLIATPDSMSKLAKVARVLGPRGLMPNPKNGTVTPKPEEAAKKFQGGQVNFKTEAKFPVLHVVVGKSSFGAKKLEENIHAFVGAIKMKNIKNVFLKSTMSPGVPVDTASL